MARHLRLQFPGAIYHVTIRGNGRQSIFADDRDRERFLKTVAGKECKVAKLLAGIEDLSQKLRESAGVERA